MSVSEQEQRILDDMEASLYIIDPNLESVLPSAVTSHRAKRLVLACSSAVGGLACCFSAWRPTWLSSESSGSS
jgi:hypothetical protein